VSLFPVGLVVGAKGEKPACIDFAAKFEHGALLTVVSAYVVIEVKYGSVCTKYGGTVLDPFACRRGRVGASSTFPSCLCRARTNRS
jgi:hypothetical protein